MYIPSSDAGEIVTAIAEAAPQKDDVVAILIGEKNRPNVEQLISGLNAKGISFFGGIFPGIIHGESRYEEGVIAIVLPALAKPLLIRGLETEQIEIPEVDDELEIITDTGSPYTALVLVDGLTSNVASFLTELFNSFGDSVSYLGGGAGSLSLQQEPCIFTRDGLFQDAAVVTFVKLHSGLGVHHGWQEIAGPLVATSTRKNVVAELNWRNAFEVYREIVEADAGVELTREGFFDVSKGYPFGMVKEGAEHIVRDPIAANEQGELVCVGEVPENTVLSILKGASDSLVQAAGQAAEDSRAMEGKPFQSLVIDCISRVLFLEDGFGRELSAVRRALATAGRASVPEGALTLGEISSSGEGLLEFYNKTIVVGVLYE